MRKILTYCKSPAVQITILSAQLYYILCTTTFSLDLLKYATCWVATSGGLPTRNLAGCGHQRVDRRLHDRRLQSRTGKEWAIAQMLRDNAINALTHSRRPINSRQRIHLCSASNKTGTIIIITHCAPAANLCERHAPCNGLEAASCPVQFTSERSAF
jgi:hypothetical protein